MGGNIVNEEFDKQWLEKVRKVADEFGSNGNQEIQKRP